MIGGEHVAALLESGLLQLTALAEDEVVSCAECRGTARLVAESEGLVAVCTGDMECPCELFGAAPERVLVEPVGFARELAAALGVDGVPGAPGVVVPLGRRALGEEVVAFDLVARPGRAGVMETMHLLARGGPRVRIVLVPDGRRLAADVPTELGGADLVWVGLEEVLVVGAPLRVDVRAIVSRRHFAGVVVEEAFDGLVLGERGAIWRGRTLDIEASPLTLRLLRLLAERPGELVGDADLWRSLYPDDHTRFGKLAKGVNPEDLKDRVRFIVGSLRAAFRKADDAAGGLVENRRGEGYLLVLPRERVRVA